MSRRVFLLSPANCGGERAQLLFSPRASFDLARRIRAPGGAPLGEGAWGRAPPVRAGRGRAGLRACGRRRAPRAPSAAARAGALMPRRAAARRPTPPPGGPPAPGRGPATRDHHPAQRTRATAPARVTSAVEIPRDVNDVEIDVGGRAVKLTNLRKVFWPDEGITKGDLLR